MPIIDPNHGTRVDEIARDTFRISTPIPPGVIPGGFTFNQILIVDDAPLLFHTGPRRLFPLVHAAVAHVLGDVARLRHVSFSHFEADECGSLNEWLTAAPQAVATCGMIGKMVSVDDVAMREAKGLMDGEELVLGAHRLRWLDAPHVPHGWDCGYLVDTTTRTLLCGDLFTQAGNEHAPITTDDILGPSEGMRSAMDYASRGPNTRAVLEKLARTEPTTLATMHGASFSGDGAALLRALADALAA